MAHTNADLYMRVTDEMRQGRTDAITQVLADDVVWHEAGNPQPIRGKEAVVQRFTGMEGASPEIQIKNTLEDDEHLAVWGHAKFRKDGETCEYDYVEEMTIRDGHIVERWSFMDAVPDDVARFFQSL